jgi:hypothetical protein
MKHHDPNAASAIAVWGVTVTEVNVAVYVSESEKKQVWLEVCS